MQADLINLPMEVQLALGAGFAAYMTAYAGRRSGHSPTDSVMISLLFGLVALWTFRIVLGLFGSVPALPAGALAAVAVAALWRKYLRQWWLDLLRVTRVSGEDGLPTVWQSVSQDMRFDISELTVRLKSGRILHCSRVHDFRDRPHGPALFGEDGSVAIYVTEVTDATGEEHPWDPEAAGDPQLTIVPSDQVEEIDIRLG